MQSPGCVAAGECLPLCVQQPGSILHDLDVFMVDFVSCLLQNTAEPRVAWLEEQLRSLGLSDGPAATGLVVGSLCLGQFSVDNNW